MMPMTSLVREKPIKPPARKAPTPRGPRTPVVTRAEVAPCTCPEPCERDHEHD